MATPAVKITKDQIIDQVLDDMKKKHGTVSSERLVQEASDPNHPLHGEFDWNDTEAAHKWRVEQAARLIRATKYVAFLKEQNETVPLRKYVSLPGRTGEYGPREKSLKSFDVREDFINRKIQVLQSWCNETADIEELQALRKVILKGLTKF
jgi:hypothetical protein